MKKFTKWMTALVLAVVAMFSFAGCEMLGDLLGGGEAAIKGVYLSPSQMSYANMRPSYNYYLTTFTHQELTIYEDGTYCLIVSSSQFSAVVLPEEGNAASANERENKITKYFGTYTAAQNELDTDLLDISLSSPTRIIYNADGNYYVDTANWTEAMGKATRVPSSVDMGTGQPIVDENTPNTTAEEYLARNAFEATTAQANTVKASFDYITLTFPKTK